MPKTILVVEDDAAIRAMVRSVLVREGFDVDLVENGVDAISRIDATHYDALVLDVSRGNTDGHEVLETLARKRPDVKCVVVISASSAAAIEDIDVANVQTKLRKPFDIKELIDAVHKAVLT